MSKRKRFVFFLITMMTPVLAGLFCVEAYFLYGYVMLMDNYCGSFAKIDSEIGWVLKPGSKSCIKGPYSAFGQELFSSRVRINAEGFRSKTIDSTTPTGGLLVIGDSQSFGYGINWIDTFSARLTIDHGHQTALLASPAYSGAQAIMLAQRKVRKVRPKTIIYFETGYWDRAVCSGRSKPVAILKPCYWVDPSGRSHLVLPKKRWVKQAEKLGLRPAGMVGAGENTLAYFLIARPIAKIQEILVRLGLLSGFGDGYSAWGSKKDLKFIRKANLQQLIYLTSDAGAQLLLIDPEEVYKEFLNGELHAEGLSYVGKTEWSKSVVVPMTSLAPNDARVPGDGHYGPGAHKLIADLINMKLDRNAP